MSDTAQLEMRICKSNDKISDLKWQLKELEKKVSKLEERLEQSEFDLSRATE